MNEGALDLVIVDDNDLDRFMLEEYAGKYDRLKLTGSFPHPVEAIEFVKQHPPQLILLDVKMPVTSGVHLLKTVRDCVPMAVFITSHPEFALEGFELSALDYILKPVTRERFDTMVQRVEEYWEMKQKATAYDVNIDQGSIFIQQGHEKIKILLSEIIYMEALHDYTKIMTAQKRYITNLPLNKFLSRLPKEKFARVHRSYAIAIDKVEKNTSVHIILQGNHEIPIGKTYKQDLKLIL